jgi:hypothetical protein
MHFGSRGRGRRGWEGIDFGSCTVPTTARSRFNLSNAGGNGIPNGIIIRRTFMSSHLCHGISLSHGVNRRASPSEGIQLDIGISAYHSGGAEGRGSNRDSDGGLTNRGESCHISSMQGDSLFHH